MSYSQSTKMEAKRKGRIVNTFDHTNIDDFFSQPSTHELATASVRRVEEIMTDLNRRTIEELENWSHGSYFEKTSKPEKYQSPSIASETIMVSFPISLSSDLLSTISATDTNCPAAHAFDSKIGIKTASPVPIHELLQATTAQSERNRNVTDKHGCTDQNRKPWIISTKKDRASLLSAVSIDVRNSMAHYRSTPFVGLKAFLPPSCSKPLPPTPEAPEEQNMQIDLHLSTRPISSREEVSVAKATGKSAGVKNNKMDSEISDSDQTVDLSQPHFSTLPSITITPPAGDHLASSHTPVKRKALPVDSPLFVQLE